MKPMLSVMILACDRHADQITRLLDDAHVGDWTIIPAAQARRMGYLQTVPRRPAGNAVIFGVGENAAIGEAIDNIKSAVHRGRLCPDCDAYVWEVQQALLSHVTLDPVCEAVVDCEHAPTVEFEGRLYCFCSEECRRLFQEHPGIYIKRDEMKYRIGKRDLPAKNAGRRAVAGSQHGMRDPERLGKCGACESHEPVLQGRW